MTPPSDPTGEKPPGLGYRWTIVALLFLATTINYIDRQALGILAPVLEDEIGWSESDYGAIISWFSPAYGIGFLGMGRFLDKVGVRRGFAFAVVAWSLAAMGHALARTAAGFSVARAALGLGESGNFPGAIKTVSEWFPKRERALATGIFNAGSNVGAIAAPLMVPWIALTWGWPAAFIATGALGFFWLAAWLLVYRSPDESKRLSPGELAWIRSDNEPEPAGFRWLALLGYRQTWAFLIGKFMTDPIWWFYLFWLPKFLDTEHGVTLSGLAAPLVVIYLVADVGSVGGGFAGAMGGVLFQRLTGLILEATGSNYAIVFAICGSAYVTALLIMHLLVPRLEPARLEPRG